MTTDEFSDAFDVMLNSYSNQAMFGESSSKADITLDEYEKSVILTQAQDIIIKSYFDKTLNPQAQGFDDSARRQMDFSNLIKVDFGNPSSEDNPYDSRGLIFKCPSDVLFVLNEKLEIFESKRDEGGKYVKSRLKSTLVVVPINYKEYDRETSKAYTQPLKKQCWRLFQSDSSTVDVKSELIPVEGAINDNDIASYKIRYVRKPNPIVLQDFTEENLSIDNISTKSECELNPSLHIDILTKAVELTLISKGRITQPQNNQ